MTGSNSCRKEKKASIKAYQRSRISSRCKILENGMSASSEDLIGNFDMGLKKNDDDDGCYYYYIYYKLVCKHLLKNIIAILNIKSFCFNGESRTLLRGVKYPSP